MNDRIVLVEVNVGDDGYTYQVDPSIARVLITRVDRYKAHWDSGQPDIPAVVVTLWDGKKTFEEKHSTSTYYFNAAGERIYPSYNATDPKYQTVRTRRFVDIKINATQEDIDRHAAFLEANRYLSYVIDRASDAYKFDQGVKVKVVRGRKVPKGEYEIVRHAEGRYGPYVDLRDAAGKEYRYVAVGNVEAIPNFAKHFASPKFQLDPVERKFIEKAAELAFADPVDFSVYADWLEEHDHLPGSLRSTSAENDEPANHVVPAYFAEYLRDAVKNRTQNGEVKLNLRAVQWYNEFYRVGR